VQIVFGGVLFLFGFMTCWEAPGTNKWALFISIQCCFFSLKNSSFKCTNSLPVCAER
jgi:hypothetical protein